ncbi:hypothetical protein PJ267_04000 [Arthrobacter sp. OVS8]|nr:hypothetical protein PJ267_04000 [Arthrobacter sp. OVS8]
MTVKLGPVNMQYKGLLNVIERNTAEHRAVLGGKAQETRGQGTAEATVTLLLTEEAGGTTRGTVSADLSLSGKAAAMGKGVIGSVTEQMMGLFASNLQAMIASPGIAGKQAAAGEPAAASGASAPGLDAEAEAAAAAAKVSAPTAPAPAAELPGVPPGAVPAAPSRASAPAPAPAPPAVWTPSASRRGSRRSSCPAQGRSWPSWRWWGVSRTGRAGARRSG